MQNGPLNSPTNNSSSSGPDSNTTRPGLSSAGNSPGYGNGGYNPEPYNPESFSQGWADISDIRHTQTLGYQGNLQMATESMLEEVLRQRRDAVEARPNLTPLILIAIVLTLVGMILRLPWLGWVGAVMALVMSIRLIWPELRDISKELLVDKWGAPFIAFLGIGISIAATVQFTGFGDETIRFLRTGVNWDAVGAVGDTLGAVGQIFIAVLAVYIAWRQYIISKILTEQQNQLTIQQNMITQQQTIDAYFQGISDLVLDEEGLLEDWPQERAIAEGRTAAILSSVNADGKAKVIRFLARSKLLTPLKRDGHLGRAILDGKGGYEEDRIAGVRVIDIGVMLAKATLSRTDLRWIDLSEANLIYCDLRGADLVKSNLSRTILYGANLNSADIMGVRLHYGPVDTASPRSRTEAPNYTTGERTGTVVEDVDFTNVQRMSEEQRQYCCAWCGEKSRATIPGGCRDIKNQLGR